MLVFGNAEFFEKRDTSRTEGRHDLHTLGYLFVPTLLARVRRNLVAQCRAPWKNIRSDTGYWNGIIASRLFVFCQARAEVTGSLARNNLQFRAEHSALNFFNQ